MSTRLNFCHRVSRHLLTGVAVCVLPAACSPGYRPPPAPVATGGASQAQLNFGHDVHGRRCASCHAFENPATYSAAELKQHILPKMSAKAKLTTDEQAAVLAYLLAVRQP